MENVQTIHITKNEIIKDVARQPLDKINMNWTSKGNLRYYVRQWKNEPDDSEIIRTATPITDPESKIWGGGEEWFPVGHWYLQDLGAHMLNLIPSVMVFGGGT